MENTAVLQLQNVSIGYSPDHKLLSAVDLEVQKGEKIALVGENGKGKTTLLKTICGIIHPLGGNVLVGNSDLRHLSAGRLASEISLVLTEKPVIGNIRVRNLIAFGRYPFTNWLGIQKDKDRHKVKEAMEWCRIEALQDKVFGELSDGERQKVMIARAIAQDARIMVLDEPTAHLDISNRIAIMKLLSRLSEEKGVAIIYSTHEIELALKNSSRLWLINDNRLYDETPESVISGDLLTKVFSVPEGYFDTLK